MASSNNAREKGGFSNWRRAGEALAVGLVSYAGSWTAARFLIEPEGMAPFWFVNGVVLAVMLRRPRRHWPELLCAAFASFALYSQRSGFSPYPNLIYGLANALEPLVGALLVSWFAPRFHLGNLRSMRVLMLSALVACASGASLAWLVGPIRWPLWFIDDLLGMLLVAPAILVFWPARRQTVSTRVSIGTFIEAVLIAIGLTAITSAVFLHVRDALAHHFFYATLPFLLWAALRFKDRGAVLACTLLAILTIAFTLEGIGPFALGTPLLADRSLSIQAVLAMLLLSHLALGVAMVERERLATLSAMQVETLELCATGKPLGDILERIVRLVESEDSDMVCSILLLDAEKGCLLHGAAPNLPEAYSRAIHGAKIGPSAGSCGAAAALGQRVVTADIATHPNWVEYRHLALPHGLRACWSTPIFSPAKEVLGTFAIYYRDARLPEAIETRWVDAATHIAAIAILRERSERAIKRGERRLRQLFETTHEGVWTVDTNYVTTYTNPRLAEILDQAPAELLGKNAIDFVHPDDREATRARTARRLQGISEQHEVRLLRRDGSIRWVVVAASPIRDEGGAIVGALGMITDITERKNLEEQVIVAQRMDSLGTLAGGIAHDFNNILMGIAGNVDLARRTLPKEAKMQARLDDALVACKRAEDLVRQILTFSRRRTGSRANIALRPVIEEALNLLGTTLPAMIDIRTAFPSTEPTVVADASQIHQIIMNLGTNAAHAVGASGGHLDVRLESLNLAVSPPGSTTELSAGQYMRLTFSDSGRGMDEATLARIFDPFFTTKPVGEGTGLGLSVVLGIVKNHGGAITVASRPGEGTTFELYFPVAQAAVQQAPAAAAEARDEPGRGESVLYVDDEASLVVLVASTLESLGYRATGLSDPCLALEKISADPGAFQAIVTDYAMPSMNGLDFARAVRRRAKTVPIILVSGHPTPEVRTEAEALDIHEILVKPGVLDELPAAVGRALRG